MKPFIRPSPRREIPCPGCGYKMQVPESLVGQKLKCSGCGGSFVFATCATPSPSPPPPAFSPPPPPQPVCVATPPQASWSPVKELGRFIGACALLSFCACGFCFMPSFDRRPQPSVAPSRPSTIDPDDADKIILMYGPPDEDESTAYDNPRPPFPTRFLTYNAERTMAIFLPDGKLGDPPPYRWKSLGFTDPTNDQKIKYTEFEKRMAKRLKR